MTIRRSSGGLKVGGGSALESGNEHISGEGAAYAAMTEPAGGPAKGVALSARIWFTAGLLAVIALTGVSLNFLFGTSREARDQGKWIKGIVHDGAGVGGVPGAVVRIQATEWSAVSGEGGTFELEVPESLAEKGTVKLAAWAKGYFIGGPVEAAVGRTDVVISIKRHSDADNPDYEWLPSMKSEGTGENQGCAECHFRGKTGAGPALPVDEWLEDAHSQSAVNPRFLSLYAGTDLAGRRSPLTRYRHTRDYGTFPLAPEMDATYCGPGYKLDFPEHAGNCAACHLPAAAVNAPYGTDPVGVSGVGAEGVNCDFCHKIWDVKLDPVTGLPFANRPGVMSFEFRRPFEGHQFFAGPLDDVAPGEDTYSELQKRSQLCAPCHFGVFWDTIVYNSFGEWLASPYSDAESGKTCQDCHMPNSGAGRFALPEKGGLERNTRTIVSHRMPGARDKALLENAVTMTLDVELEGEGKAAQISSIVADRFADSRILGKSASLPAAKESAEENSRRKRKAEGETETRAERPEGGGGGIGVRAKVKVVNDLTGHHVPTDSPLRHVILVVRAYDEGGRELELRSGPTLPEWCGVGRPEDGCYSGLPGKVFVKLLEEAWTGVSPTAAYWNPTRVVMDTRLGAFESDVSEYVFEAPDAGGAVKVEAVLLYRRAFKDLMDRKGWTDSDIVMESLVWLQKVTDNK